MADELMVIFENAPGPEPARFVDVENVVTGESVSIDWSNYGDADRWELGPFVKHEDAARLEARCDFYRRRYAKLSTACRALLEPWRPGTLDLTQTMNRIRELVRDDDSDTAATVEARGLGEGE